MLPRAFRTLQSVSSCFRSPLSATEPLSDPLRKILEFEFALIQPQVNLLGFASHRCVCTGSPFGSGTVAFKESLRYRTQQRHISDQTAVKSDDLVVYEGPLSKAVLSLKRLSLFSCAVTFATSPIILIFDTSATGLGAKASIAATLCTFGIFTTGLLHWFTSPYVRRLVYDRRSETLDLETLSVLARLLHTRAHLSEVTYPDTMRPQVTFKARGKYFYVDPDHFPDRALLAALMPPEPSAAGSDVTH